MYQKNRQSKYLEAMTHVEALTVFLKREDFSVLDTQHIHYGAYTKLKNN